MEIEQSGNTKKHMIRTELLRLLALLAVSAYICACMVTLRALLFTNDGFPAALVIYAFSTGLAYLSGGILREHVRPEGRFLQSKAVRFAAFMLNIGDTGRFVRSVAAWAAMVIPAAVSIAVYSRQGVLRMLFESMVVIFAYIIVLKHSAKAPVQILNNTGLYAGLTVLTICLELPFLVGRLSYLRPWHFGTMYLLIFSYIIIKNQENIDKNIYDKKHVEKAVLPGNLRRFNTELVFIVFLAVLILFNFKQVIIWLLYLAGRVIGTAVMAVIWLVKQLMPLSETVSPDLSAGAEALPEMPMQPPTPLTDLIFNIFKNFILLYLAYRLVFFAASKIPAIVSRVAGWLRRLFRIKGAYVAVNEGEYVDVTETVPPLRRKTAGSLKIKKRRTFRHLRKIKDPAQRIRYMYGLILDSLVKRGIRLTAADTPGEIAEKASASGSLPEDIRDGLRRFTGVYEQVRYGERVPDEDTLAGAEAYCEKTAI